jgi:hypothetical protein
MQAAFVMRGVAKRRDRIPSLSHRKCRAGFPAARYAVFAGAKYFRA